MWQSKVIAKKRQTAKKKEDSQKKADHQNEAESHKEADCQKNGRQKVADGRQKVSYKKGQTAKTSKSQEKADSPTLIYESCLSEP